jgi:hypothetical protein
MSEIRREPLHTASTWTASDLARSEDWIHRLSAAEVSDLEAALAHARATGKPMGEITREEFPLPVLGQAIDGWLETLQRGRGFLNIKGVPVNDDAEKAAWLHWGIGLHLGTAVSQNAAGDLLGHVRDTGADPTDTSVRLYKTRVRLGFHSDGADLVGLLCVRQGRGGGENRLVSTTTLYNEILRRRPDLVPLLFEPFYWDRNDEQREGEPPYFALPICSYAEGELRFFYIGWYIRGAQRHDVPRLTPDQTALLDLIDEIATDPALHVTMKLEPGEINYLKNNTVLHARTEYEDFEEPSKKRHLVRLWLSGHGAWGVSDARLQQGIPAKDGVVSDADAIAAGAR